EELYGTVSDELFQKAKQYILDNPLREDKSKELSAKQIAKHFEYFLEKNRLISWKVKLSEKAKSISVDPYKKTIYINKKSKRSKNKLKALLIHEIGTHVYRYANGALQDYKIFKRGTGGYLDTEEGLAIYNQKQLDLNLGIKDIWPAYLVIAIYHAKTMS